MQNTISSFLFAYKNNRTHVSQIRLFICSFLYIIMGLARLFLPKSKNIKINNKNLELIALKHSNIIWFLIYSLIWGIIENLILPMSLINTIYKDIFHLSDNSIGIVFSLATLVSCIAFFVSPLLFNILDQTKFINTLFMINTLKFLYLPSCVI